MVTAGLGWLSGRSVVHAIELARTASDAAPLVHDAARIDLQPGQSLGAFLGKVGKAATALVGTKGDSLVVANIGPLPKESSRGIKDLNALIVAVGHIDPIAVVDGDAVGKVEDAVLGARGIGTATPQSQEGSIGGEFHDPGFGCPPDSDPSGPLACEATTRTG